MKFKIKNDQYVESTLVSHILNSLVLPRFPEGEVDWERYAHQYDAVTIEIKRAYQKVMRMPLDGELASKLNYDKCTLLCDLGGGTGNLSITLARRYPHLVVINIDSDSAYDRIAQKKAKESAVTNIYFHLADAEDIKRIQEQYGKQFDIVFMIHALYTMRTKEDMEKPQRVLKAVYESLTDNGCLWITDIEKEMNMLQLIVDGLLSAIRKYGLRKAMALFKEMDQAKNQNANLIRRQRDGTYITQSVDGLVDMICKAGFRENRIVYKSAFKHYHGYDNIVVVRK